MSANDIGKIPEIGDNTNRLISRKSSQNSLQSFRAQRNQDIERYRIYQEAQDEHLKRALHPNDVRKTGKYPSDGKMPGQRPTHAFGRGPSLREIDLEHYKKTTPQNRGSSEQDNLEKAEETNLSDSSDKSKEMVDSHKFGADNDSPEFLSQGCDKSPTYSLVQDHYSPSEIHYSTELVSGIADLGIIPENRDLPQQTRKISQRVLNQDQLLDNQLQLPTSQQPFNPYGEFQVSAYKQERELKGTEQSLTRSKANRDGYQKRDQYKEGKRKFKLKHLNEYKHLEGDERKAALRRLSGEWEMLPEHKKKEIMEQKTRRAELRRNKTNAKIERLENEINSLKPT